MGRRLQAYLHQNRVGTFTFRWRPPSDVAEHFAQRAFEYSLGTKIRSEAWHRALPVTLRAKAIVTQLRAMKPPKKRIFTTELVRSVHGRFRGDWLGPGGARRPSYREAVRCG